MSGRYPSLPGAGPRLETMAKIVDAEGVLVATAVSTAVHVDDVCKESIDNELKDIEEFCSIERFSVPGGASVYVVGTAHVSSRSCDDVQEVIRRLKPQVRTRQIEYSSPQNPPVTWRSTG